MDIKEAEKIWSGESTCFRIFDIIECARTIVEDRENQITARDQRIAELEEDFRTMQVKATEYRLMNSRSEKDRDEARRDAIEIASLLKTSAEQLCLERGGVVNEYVAYNTAVYIIEKYEDTK